MMSTLYLAWKNFTGHLGKTLSGIFPLAAGILVLTFFFGCWHGIYALTLGSAMDDANNRIVRMYSYALTESGSMTRVNMTDADFADIASLPHVEDISVKYVLRGEVTSVSYSGREVRPPYEYVCTDAAYSAFTGAETEALTGGGEYIVAGRDFAAGDELCALVEEIAASRLGIDAVGGDFGSLTVSLRSSVTGEEKTVTLDIVGIYDGALSDLSGSGEYEYRHGGAVDCGSLPFVFTSDVTEIVPVASPATYEHTQSGLDEIVIGVDSAAAAAEVAAALENGYDNYIYANTTVAEELARSVNDFGAVIGALGGMLIASALVNIFVFSLLRGLERRRATAMLKAFGYTNGRLAAAQLLEFAFISLSAAVPGGALAYAGLAGMQAVFFDAYPSLAAAPQAFLLPFGLFLLIAAAVSAAAIGIGMLPLIFNTKGDVMGNVGNSRNL